MVEKVRIRDVTVSGEGVGVVDGLTVFVDGALPGEEVVATIRGRKSTYAKGDLVKVLEESPFRVKPICPVFGRCGGCQIMHLAYQEQLILKRKKVVDAFERIGKLKGFSVAPCVASPKPLYYRNKIQLPVDANLKVGLYAKRSHEIVPIEKCYIQSEAGDQILQELEIVEGMRQVFIRSNRRGETLIVLVTSEKPSPEVMRVARALSLKKGVVGVLHGLNAREDNVLRSDAYTLLFGQGEMEEEVLGVRVLISPASFFQVNLEQAEHLYQKAFELAGLRGGERVLDAYSGIGVFTVYLAKSGAIVTGIEVVEPAVKDAQKNALKNGVEVDFQLGKVEDFIEKLPPFDVIFLNPPRKGCEESVLRAVARGAPKKVMYTSCDPATLARDLSYLAAEGYTKVDAYPFDMFPQTMHVEIVVKIEKEG